MRLFCIHFENLHHF